MLSHWLGVAQGSVAWAFTALAPAGFQLSQLPVAASLKRDLNDPSQWLP